MPRVSTNGKTVQRSASLVLPVLPLRDAVHFPGAITTLHVVREQSISAVNAALRGDKRILALSQRDMSQDEPGTANLCRVGTIDEILQATAMPDGSVRLIVRGLGRSLAKRFTRAEGNLEAHCEPLRSQSASGPSFAYLVAEVKDSFCRLAEVGSIPPEAGQHVHGMQGADEVADNVAHYLSMSPSEKQCLLEELSSEKRLQQLLALLEREHQSQKLRADLRAKTAAAFSNSQREILLRQQLKAIQSELGGEESAQSHSSLRQRLANVVMPEETREYIHRQIDVFARIPEASPEIAAYERQIEALLRFPWSISAPERLDLPSAKAVLDRNHFGLREAKERVLEFLAVRKLTGGNSAPVLCFVGPAGVGKTTFARDIAAVLGRPLVSIALGGVRDEAELRGHRRTYVGAQPGRIAQGLLACGVDNPVIVLDELDKVSFDNSRSDVAAALLEILDPASNREFRDNFLEAGINLRKVLFIATANSTAGLPPALRDRLEIIAFPSYSIGEKLRIANEFLFPKLMEANGLSAEDIAVPPLSMDVLVRKHAREPGVRQLERALAALCRKASLRKVMGEPGLNVDSLCLEQCLGVPVQAVRRPGAIAALAVDDLGGALFYIEVEFLEPVSHVPELRLTGSMGEVMRESAEAAYSFIRSGKLLPSRDVVGRDIHIHAHESASLKEGPSAGLAIALGLYAKAAQIEIPPDVGVTGEITLSGQVLPVGGVREKLIAAQRNGIGTVILPRENLPELNQVPADVREELRLVLVDTVAEAIEAVFSCRAANPSLR